MMKTHHLNPIKPAHHSTSRLRCLPIVVGLAVVGAFWTPASATDLVATASPDVNGTGANMTARWFDAGEVDGQSIDVFVEIIAHTGAEDYVIITENDDFKFQFVDGTPGEQRSATLRWTFYEAGTNTPISLPNLAFAIDDLDDNSRHESLSTADAYGYTVNSPTEIDHSMISGIVSASGAGGISHSPGEPEGAVKLLFADKSSLVITYETEFDGADKSAFHHDGDGDFVFDDPEVRLFYTYSFTNNEAESVTVDFSDDLPAGLFWDADFGPEVTGGLSGGVPVFSNGHRNVSISGLILGPGSSSLTLGTLETGISGTIENTATLTPTSPSGPSENATATITLP